MSGLQQMFVLLILLTPISLSVSTLILSMSYALYLEYTKKGNKQ